MQAELETIVKDAAQLAGDYLRERAFDYGELEWKKLDDPVTDADKQTELMIRGYIQAQLPGTSIRFFGEEYGDSGNEAEVNVYIDPIDGTKAYVRGEFHTSVSIMAEYQGEVAAAAVNDFMRGIMYHTESGKAYLSHEQRKLELPRETPHLSKTSVLAGESLERKLNNKDFSTRRQAGSVALGMAQTAAGSYDAMIMGPYKKGGQTDTCDIGAGYALLKAAGFELYDANGKDFDYHNPNNGIIAVKPEDKEKFMDALFPKPKTAKKKTVKKKEKEPISYGRTLRTREELEREGRWGP